MLMLSGDGVFYSEGNVSYINLGENPNVLEKKLFAQEFEYLIYSYDLTNNITLITSLDSISVGDNSRFSFRVNDCLSENSILFGELIEFSGLLKIRNIVISGTIINTGSAQINSSGEFIKKDPPILMGTPPKAKNGFHGGSILILPSKAFDSPLLMLADGGDGQDGVDNTDGFGGEGGDGGDGGSIRLFLHSNYLSAISDIKKFTKISLESVQGILVILDMFKEIDEIVTITNGLNIVLERFRLNQQNISDIEEVISLKDSSIIVLKELNVDYLNRLRASVSAVAGNGGVQGGGFKALIGPDNLTSDIVSGKPGRVDIELFSDYGGVYSKLKILEGEVEDVNFKKRTLQSYIAYNKMLLKKANNLYIYLSIGKSEENLKKLSSLFKLLMGNLSFTDKIESDHPAEITELSAVYLEAQSYYRKLSRGQDFFGHGYDYVPLQSQDELVCQFEITLADFSTIDDYYSEFISAFTRNIQYSYNADQFDIMKNLIIKNLDLTSEDIVKKISHSGKLILELSDPIRNSNEILMSSLSKLKVDISNYYQFPVGFDSFTGLISALTTVAFHPKSFMLGVQGASLTGDIINHAIAGASEISDDHGGIIDKGLLIDRVSSISNDLDNLHEEFIKLNLGHIDVNDPSGAKILAEKRAFDQIFSGFETKLPDDIAEVKVHFDSLINLVISRNNEVIRYNIYVDVLNENDSKTMQLQLISDQNKVGLASDPSSIIPSMIDGISQVYNNMRQQVLSDAYMACRSIQFCTLDERNIMENYLENVQIPANLTFSNLDGELKGAIQKSSFKTNPSQFPSDQLDDGAIIEFNDIDLLKALKENGQVQLTVPIIRKTDAPLPDFWKNNLLHNQSNIRITQVRVWLDGVKIQNRKDEAKESFVEITVTHLGTDSFTTPNNELLTFKHETVNKTFTYNYITKDIDHQADFGIINNSSEQKFALLGPFTNWLIKVNGIKPIKIIEILKALDLGIVEEGSKVIIEGENYTVSSIDDKNGILRICVSAFAIDKEFTIRRGMIKDQNNKVINGNEFYVLSEDPSYKYVDLSDVTAIRLEFLGNSLTFDL